MTGGRRSPRIYTRQGDGGETGILGPRRLRKDHPRVEAYGAVDELNAWLGAARCECEELTAGPGSAAPEDPPAGSAGQPDVRRLPAQSAVRRLAAQLKEIQGDLLALGAELATDPAVASESHRPRIGAEDVAMLERHIDELEEELEPLGRFILPGGSRLAATLHIARTVARRAERRAVTLAAREPVRAEVLAYLNRLSDLLFVMARRANAAAGVADEPWVPRR